jgi:uncharacterized NAD(P)/FAD-binding protein YdhS
MVPVQDDTPMVGLGEADSLVDRAWGTSQEWFLELKDGQRLRISEGIRSIMPVVDDRLTRRVQQWVDAQRYDGSETSEEEIKYVGSETELARVTKEDFVPEEGGEAILAEPLAMVMPPEDGTCVLAELAKQVHSDWVLNKLKAFGKLVGASYECLEEQVLEVLMAIDARRRLVGPGSRKSTPSGKKGSKELKGLVSTIN